MTSIRLIIFFCLLLSVINGCSYTRSPVIPIPFTEFSSGSGSELIILLPGLGDRPEGFQRHGFIETLKKCNPDLQIIGVDAHFAYYRNRTISARLYQDIILPAKQRGIKRIWLAGISLGGLGAIEVIIDKPGEIDGAILLAPYLGEQDDLSTLLAAKNILNWISDNDNDSTQLWNKLIERKKTSQLPEIYLGTGDSDRFIELQIKLEQILDNENIYITSGGHDWNTWGKLWAEILATHSVCSKETTKNQRKTYTGLQRHNV